MVPCVAEWPPQRERQHHQEDGEEACGEPRVHERDGGPVLRVRMRVRLRDRLRVRAGLGVLEDALVGSGQVDEH